MSEEEASGLTLAELEVMGALVQAWEHFLALPLGGGSADDSTQFRYAIHSAQQVLGQRVLHREHPDYWR